MSAVAFQPVTPVRGAYKDRKVSGRYRLFCAVGAVLPRGHAVYVQYDQRSLENAARGAPTQSWKALIVDSDGLFHRRYLDLDCFGSSYNLHSRYSIER